MTRSSVLRAAVAWIVLVACTPATASYIYTYVGNNFNTGGNFGSVFDNTMSVSGFLVLDTPLALNLYNGTVSPSYFSFTNGIATFTNTSVASGSSMHFWTDSSGTITNWNITLGNGFQNPASVNDTIDSLLTRNSSLGDSVVDSGSVRICLGVTGTTCNTVTLVGNGSILNNPGSWTVTAVPIPSTLWLFSSGLLGLIGISRRKKSV